MRQAVTLSAIRNRDRMSVEAMLLIAKPSVREVIRQIPRLVQTVVPEPFRLYIGNSKGVLVNPTGICIADHGSLFITDNKTSCLFLARLHYPVEITEVSRSLRGTIGITYANGAVFAADTGNGRLAYKATLSSVFIEPKKMRIDELRIQVEERHIPTVAEARKKELVGALWISAQRKSSKVFSNRPKYATTRQRNCISLTCNCCCTQTCSWLLTATLAVYFKSQSATMVPA